MANELYGVDISWCQKDAVNFDEAPKHAAFAIIRMGQDTFMDSEWLTHWANACRVGWPAAGYFFMQPNRDAVTQIGTLKNIIAETRHKGLPIPGRIFLDIENIRYQVNTATDEEQEVPETSPVWSRYEAQDEDLASVEIEGAGDSVGAWVNIVPPDKGTFSWWLSNLTGLFWDGMNEGLPVAIKPGAYTRQDYWNEWIVPSGKEAKLPSGASYTMPDWDKRFEGGKWPATWVSYLPGVSNPLLPFDWHSWEIWQIEGGTNRTEGITGPVDLNVANTKDWNHLVTNILRCQYPVVNKYNPTTPPPDEPPVEPPVEPPATGTVEKTLAEILAEIKKISKHFAA